MIAVADVAVAIIFTDMHTGGNKAVPVRVFDDAARVCDTIACACNMIHGAAWCCVGRIAMCK